MDIADSGASLGLMSDAAPTLTRADVILAIASGADGQYNLDPIRLMKGCFLVSRRGRPEWRAAFAFQPYDYGPFDRGVYDARDSLVRDGLLAEDQRGRYPAYALTETGGAKAGLLRDDLGEQDATWFAKIGHYVTSKSFSQLLDEIYRAFPDFAVPLGRSITPLDRRCRLRRAPRGRNGRGHGGHRERPHEGRCREVLAVWRPPARLQRPRRR
jgi:hypothetical protein